MNPTNTVTPSHLLETARVIPIAELCPDLPEPNAKAVGGVVTITWPYNKVKGTFAFNLAEPDFRLRRNRGQVRIDFTGRAAKAVGDCGLGGNDEVRLSLKGAAWEAEAVNKRRSLPGADVGWRLVFSNNLVLEIKRAETNETDLVIVDEQPDEPETAPTSTPVQPLATTRSPSPSAPLSPARLTQPREMNTNKFGDNEFASPAFVRRAKMSYGSLFEGGFDIFQDDGGVEGRGRKRTRFGRDSGAWRYTSRSPSPEPVAESPESADEQVSSPARLVSSPTKARIADQGSQAMEPDQSSPSPISTPLEAQADVIAQKDVPVNDAPVDMPADSATDRKSPTSPLKGWLSESMAQNAPPPTSNEIPPPDLGVPPPPSDQQPGLSRYGFASDPWTTNTTLESQQQAPLPPHVHESFAPSDFGHVKSSNESIPFNKPASPGRAYPLDDEDQGPFDDGVIHSSEPNPSTIGNSPAESTEDMHPQIIHDEALTNYPAIYLEAGHMTQRNQAVTEQASQYPAVAELGSSSWTTVNNSSKATAKAPMDRLRSRDGDTPEKALVIDESDAESDSEPEPVAVEDTVNSGRAYDQDMYEDAEAEDEADAQYSDDDEPEYDADEMGGDYDTRNYEHPGDDDDGSSDEDLRPQPTELEFDDGEGWDEDEQEEFADEEDEDEYGMDEEVVEPAPQPAVRANPTVIDLISSSEDEAEYEDEGDGNDAMSEIKRSGAHIDSRMSPSYQQTSDGIPQEGPLHHEESEFSSQASISEAENSSEASREHYEHASSDEEEEEEERFDEVIEEEEGDWEDEGDSQGGGIGDEAELTSFKPREVEELELSENQAQWRTEPKIKSLPEAGPKGDATPGDTYNHANISYRPIEQEIGSHESIGIESRRETLEEDSVVEPLSAADGLEILSRVVDEESNAGSRGALTELAAEEVVEIIPDEQSPEPAEKEGTRVQEELLPRSEEENEGEPIASPIINKEELATAAPSSPPLTRSFRSISEDKPTTEETAITSAGHTSTAQLPTPLNTQITDNTLNTSISTSMNIAESFGSYTTIEQPDLEPKEGLVFGKSADDLVQQDYKADMGQDTLEQEHSSAPPMVLQAQQPLGESPIASSPALSFQTQVDDAEPALSDDVEQLNDNDPLDQRSSSELSSSASSTSEVFTSHMEIDEELQASILEGSHLEGYLGYDVRDEYDEELQASILEEYQLERYSDDDSQDDGVSDDDDVQDEDDAESVRIGAGALDDGGRDASDEELQASILEEYQLEGYSDGDGRDDDDAESVRIETVVSDDNSLDGSDEELQASILEGYQFEGYSDDDDQDDGAPDGEGRDEDDVESGWIDTSEAYIEPQPPSQANIMPFSHEHTPAKQIAEDISAQLKRNFVASSGSSEDESDTSTRNDPSVHLARIANAAKRGKKRAASTNLYRPRKRPFDARRSSTPETDNSSMQLARASFGSQTPRSDEDSDSMVIAKLQLARHLRDELPEFTSLKVLRQHLTKSLDVIAVAMMKPPDPQRAKGGPRQFMMSFTISDYSIGPYKVDEVLIYRTHRDTLPVIKYGDVVLLRNFTVVSLANKGFGLRSNEESSWAVFDYEGEPPQINGPPVEYNDRETLYVDYLREWFRLLDGKARGKLEMANQKLIGAGKSQ
ncbi:hypothetical protein F5X98DRAFT_351980 [Xylaria grammica]|nr:hypothetical protein F5X98DRAFT_351980 [Xylaria grammica]